ncbi:MAG: hypothetical protein GY944_26860, partial [bacterium]|nr:hypothetical protein [bacterium]
LVAVVLWAAVAGPLRFQRERDPRDLLATGVVLVILVLSVSGRTKGEVARLWIFLVPMLTLVATVWVQRALGSKWARPALVLLVLGQLGWAITIKRCQDVWPW